MTNVTLAIPSKGRLMEQTADMFARAGLEIRKTGEARGYRGEIAGLNGIDIIFTSSSEIAENLKAGRVHMGVTGEDLIRESMSDADTRVQFLNKLGFGFADVVIAVPDCWLDVTQVEDLERMARIFRQNHKRLPRVATKYINMTRRFFAQSGFSAYRIIESLGATEGAPAAGTAEMIVDITTTGATLKANGLRILEDGVMLRSEANLIASNAAAWTNDQRRARDHLQAALSRKTCA
jgi:ATP phosphoribosyltransferase